MTKRSAQPVLTADELKRATANVAGSKWENALARQLEDRGLRHGTEFVRQFPFAAPERRFRADFAFPIGWKAKLLVEVDGGGGVYGRHGRISGMEDHAESAIEAISRKHVVLRVPHTMVRDGRALAAILRLRACLSSPIG